MNAVLKPVPHNDPPTLTVTALVRLAVDQNGRGPSAGTVRKYAASGLLPATKDAKGRLLFRASDARRALSIYQNKKARHGAVGPSQARVKVLRQTSWERQPDRRTTSDATYSAPSTEAFLKQHNGRLIPAWASYHNVVKTDRWKRHFAGTSLEDPRPIAGVKCPSCGAKRWNPCLTDDGKPSPTYHLVRVREANSQAAVRMRRP